MDLLDQLVAMFANLDLLQNRTLLLLHAYREAHGILKTTSVKVGYTFLTDLCFSMLINVKMPTIVGILTFTSRINFVLSFVIVLCVQRTCIALY